MWGRLIGSSRISLRRAQATAVVLDLLYSYCSATGMYDNFSVLFVTVCMMAVKLSLSAALDSCVYVSYSPSRRFALQLPMQQWLLGPSVHSVSHDASFAHANGYTIMQNM